MNVPKYDRPSARRTIKHFPIVIIDGDVVPNLYHHVIKTVSGYWSIPVPVRHSKATADWETRSLANSWPSFLCGTKRRKIKMHNDLCYSCYGFIKQHYKETLSDRLSVEIPCNLSRGRGLGEHDCHKHLKASRSTDALETCDCRECKLSLCYIFLSDLPERCLGR